MSEQQQVLTVSELNGFIKDILENVPPLSNIMVRGELSNYKIYPSGHHYFTLKDGDSALKCVMFKGSAMKLRFRPESGMGVLAIGRVSVYPRDGAYQLYCSDMRMGRMGFLRALLKCIFQRLLLILIDCHTIL